jgi:hypothetical protein
MISENQFTVADLRRRETLDKVAQHRSPIAGGLRTTCPTADSLRRQARPALLLALLALLAFGGHAALARDAGRLGVGPSLTTVSPTNQTARLFTVAGAGFTPGGRVYLAIYDAMGARLYETRWVVAGAVLSVEMGPTGHEAAGPRSGALREAFAGLCGATAMMRGPRASGATG